MELWTGKLDWAGKGKCERIWAMGRPGLVEQERDVEMMEEGRTEIWLAGRKSL